jgi:hypothetical protein
MIGYRNIQYERNKNTGNKGRKVVMETGDRRRNYESNRKNIKLKKDKESKCNMKKGIKETRKICNGNESRGKFNKF